MIKHYPVAIIGGGISGISFAHFAAQQGHKGILLEQNDKSGGCIETYYSPKAPGFWLELGTHTLYNSYQHLIRFCQENTLLTHLQAREKHSFKLLTPQNTIASILSALNPICAGIGLLLFKLTKAHDRTIEEYFSFVFGRQNYQKTLRYCFDAVLCQESHNFPADFLFKKRAKNRSLPRSFTLKEGMSSLFANITNSNIDISFNTKVEQIRRQGTHWQIKAGTQIIYADKIVLATPWQITQEFLVQINHPIASIAHQPGFSHLTSIALIFDKNKIKHIKPFNGLIGIQQNFFSMVTRDTVAHETYRGMTVHFKDTKEPCKQLINEFLTKLAISHSALVDAHYKYNTLPCYQSQHKQFLCNLHAELAKDKTLSLTGNYFTRLAVEDCVKRSFEEAIRLFA